MGPNPFLGVIFHWIGGFCSATNFIPFRGIKRWSWEVYWIIQGFAAWIIAPPVLAYLLVPHVSSVMQEAYATHPADLRYALLFGILWGVGGITFGLAIRYLGIALGYAIALGLCAFFGTLVPPIFRGEIGSLLHQTSGKIILLGITSPKRSALLPDLPTLEEQGLHGVDVDSWVGLHAPGGTPPATIEKLYGQIAKLMATDDVRRVFLTQGAVPEALPPAEFGAKVREESDRWAPVVKASGATLD